MPGLPNQVADAASRHPVSCNFIATVSLEEHDSPDVVEQALVAAIQRETSENLCLQWRNIVDQTNCDPALSKLLLAIGSDFHGDVANSHIIQPYFPFREGYYVFDGVILYRDRIVVPVSLRGTVLKALHAAHQGVSAMERHARATVFWPGMTQDIKCSLQPQCALPGSYPTDFHQPAHNAL